MRSQRFPNTGQPQSLMTVSFGGDPGFVQFRERKVYVVHRIFYGEALLRRRRLKGDQYIPFFFGNGQVVFDRVGDEILEDFDKLVVFEGKLRQ